MEPSAARQRRRLTATVTDLEALEQRAFLIGVTPRANDLTERSLDELALLTETAGSDPVHGEVVVRREIDPGTFIGSGKAAELAQLTEALDIDVVVFDNDLTPAQQRNLQKVFKCDVVDRVALILDIFAQHASSREGRLQVELALLRYHLPRLRGKGTELSRLGGGIGTRGPGETKLETDRRRIGQRIAKLERELKEVRGARSTQRKARQRAELPVVALVGYTNAGKSTLLNQLTGAGVLAHDQLFSTLDSTVRRWEETGSQPVLLSDTVGFVRRLPHQLVEAFRSTLAEVVNADLLLHVVDASDPAPEEQIAAVREVLAEIDADHLPELLVFNKVDRVEAADVQRALARHHHAVAVSAKTGAGIAGMRDAVNAQLRAQTVELDLEIPYERGDVLSALHRLGEVVKEVHGNNGTTVVARVPRIHAAEFETFA